VNGEEPVGSMGTDTPLACLSDKPQLLFNYFKQLFAQVTNPPIDPIREELVMSLTSYIGTERNILEETPQALPHAEAAASDPDQSRSGKAAPRSLGRFSGHHAAHAVPRGRRRAGAEKRALDGLCRRASLAIKSGYTLLILSDRGVDPEYAPIPSLLALTAVHNHLVRENAHQVALIVESGEPREVMHFALLIGYGASAVNPYLAIETLEDMACARAICPGRSPGKRRSRTTSRRSTRAC
jgi:glutamate synthase (NADPH) large chain